jgi:hypothetical protein
MEVGHVVIQIRLADLGVGGENVYDERAEIMVLRPCQEWRSRRRQLLP